MGRGERLPARDRPLARLAGGRGHVQGLVDGLVGDLGGQPEQGAEPGGHARAEVGDMVDLVAVQVDGGREGDLDLIGGDNAPDQVGPGAAALLDDCQQRRDVVAGVGEVGGQEGVVEVELAHRGAVGPGGPLGGYPRPRAEAKHGRPAVARMGQGLGTSRRRRVPVQGGHGHGHVVQQPVGGHLGHLRLDRHRVSGHLGQPPGQLLLPREPLARTLDPHLMVAHWLTVPRHDAGQPHAVAALR